MLVMPYLEGADVVSILRQPDHPAWRENIVTWMRTAGAMLSTFHIQHPADGSGAASTEVKELAERFRIGRTFDGVDWQGRTAGSYGDFGPGNLHASVDGDLYLLDPPLATTSSPVHRDLGNFIFELRRQLDGRGYTPSPPLSGHFERLCDSFLQGYFDAWEASPDDTDLALIALFELRRAPPAWPASAFRGVPATPSGSPAPRWRDGVRWSQPPIIRRRGRSPSRSRHPVADRWSRRHSEPGTPTTRTPIPDRIPRAADHSSRSRTCPERRLPRRPPRPGQSRSP